jgi:hypothetical protein
MFQNQIANKMSGILFLDLVELEISRGKMVLPLAVRFYLEGVSLKWGV